MSENVTLMYSEAQSASGLVDGQRTVNAKALAAIKAEWMAAPPKAVLTLARGSSDNAATFARYLIERELGTITGSLAPSVSSVYNASVDFRDSVILAISQSGRSPDIITTAAQAKASGAVVIALVNDVSSPLATEADHVLDIAAGPELSVAATKSFTLSLTAVLELIALLSGNRALAASLVDLPEQINVAWQEDWSGALSPFADATNALVIARGHAFGIAQEIALKLKETCSIHAEAISSAEVQHGPMTLIGKDFPVLMLGQDDQTRADTIDLARRFAARGARVMHSGLDVAEGISLPYRPANPIIAPLLQLQSFYRLCERLSRHRGFDPDRPAHLNKVTKTL